jgi:Na+-transporting NADH:ubiquinone oxidoreductase subunit F
MILMLAVLEELNLQEMGYAIGAFVLIGVFLTALILFTKAKLVSQEECLIKINDDPELTKVTPAGVTLLQALSVNNIPIPSPCGGKATCKQCVVQITEGATEALETDKATFSKQQIKEGFRLSCQCKVKHNLGVHIDLEALNVDEFEGTVISNKNVATFIKELVVEIPKELHYKAGEYLQFHVPPFKTNTNDWKETMDPKFYPDWEKFGMFSKEIDFTNLPPLGSQEVIRAYSFASYPGEGRFLRFNIRIATPPFEGNRLNPSIPWGICSSYTFSLKPGDKIKLTGPFGESYMKEDERELVFLIGGAGSSFGRSHVLDLFRTKKTKRRCTFWYGARSLKENFYEEEYRELEKYFPNFKYYLVLSEPLPEDLEAGWPKEDPLKTNYLFKAFKEGQLNRMEDPEEALYYVCGPPMHNKSVMKLLDDYGVPRENIILDDFGN